MLKPPRNWRFFIFQKAVLKDIVDFFNMLIGVEGGENSCGSTGQGRPRRRKCAEEAPRHAREPLAAWSGNQHSRLTQPFKKKGAQAIET